MDTTKRRAIAALCAVLSAAFTTACAQDKDPDASAATPPFADDRKAVERAVMDYCEAFYENKPEYLERSVDPGLTKFGYIIGRDGAARKLTMTFDQAADLAKKYERRNPGGPKEVRVIDVREHIACAMLTAEWGVDYMNLHKVDGKWKIAQVVWQSPTPRLENSGSEPPTGASARVTPAAPSFEAAAAPATTPPEPPPLSAEEQNRFNAVALALLKAINAEDKAAYRGLHSDAGWVNSIDWWQNMFAGQRAKFGSIVRAYPCTRGTIRSGALGFRCTDLPQCVSFVAIFEENVGGILSFELDRDGKISATSVFIKEEIAAYSPSDSKPFYSR